MKTLKTYKTFNVVSVVLLTLFIAFCIYGFATDCPNTTGYVYCGNASEGWSLQRWSQQNIGHN